MTAPASSFGLALWLSTVGVMLWWRTEVALLALPVLYFGYVYRQKEGLFHVLQRPYSYLILFILLILIKVYEIAAHVAVMICPLVIGNVLVFVADTVVGTLLLVGVSKWWANRGRGTRMLAWTGRRTLVYYFLCGGTPLAASALFGRIGLSYDGSYWPIVAVFLTAYALATVLTWIIYKAFPRLLG